ncbi:MAG TPA: hypothetical protein VH092_33845 [Urbifossiella sp.]|nr:hypothetical protein [Urbifossiella sp.]
MTAVIVIPRGLARSVRALARKCVSGRPRGPAPPVVFGVAAGTLTAWARADDAALVYSAPAHGGDARLVVPMPVLEAVEGGGDDPVELAVGPGLRGEARWADGGVSRTHPFDAILPGKQHRPPDPPDAWHPAPEGLLAALHECGRAVARDAGRYALSRVQVRGRAGQVVATDGRTALLQSGFSFPFAENVLVPALPVFGSRELAAGRQVRIGQTTTHLVVGAGPWQVYLLLDRSGRYPDVAGVVPGSAPTVAEIGPADAAVLVDRLPGLPGAGADHRPVTLVLDRGVAVLARDEQSGRVERVRLDGSAVSGPPARVAVDRRALALGCNTVRVSAPGRPVVVAGGNVTLVTVALTPPAAVDHPEEIDLPPPDAPERRSVVKPDPTVHPPEARPDPPGEDVPDLLAAAEGLRAAVVDAVAKAGRLVTALKARRPDPRALARAWAAVKALPLGPGGGP